MSRTAGMAPPLQVTGWLNTPAPLTLAALRGRVVVLHAFQMLCPGCVTHGLPQAQRLRAAFAEHELAVIALHTVFEHHAAMTETALRAFLHEYHVTLPVATDAPVAGARVPATMQAYGLRGTPSLVVIDAEGRVLGALIGRLTRTVGATAHRASGARAATAEPIDGALDLDCSDAGCRLS
jgi:hypothetical protein